VLLTADGVGTNEIMRRTAKSKTCVWRWQERFIEEGFDGASLQDASLAHQAAEPRIDDSVPLFSGPLLYSTVSAPAGCPNPKSARTVMAEHLLMRVISASPPGYANVLLFCPAEPRSSPRIPRTPFFRLVLAHETLAGLKVARGLARATTK
jgi:hypothetical protein